MSIKGRYIDKTKLSNYEITADAVAGPVTEKIKFVMLPFEHLSDIPTAEDTIIDQIASFFEKEKNWVRLRNCWIGNGRSEDLRQLLKEALEREE